MSARTRIGAGLVALYPEPWRERYGEEMRALLEDDPPGARGLLSLLWGALRAHVRPQRCWRQRVESAAAMRLSVGALFACWMLVSVAGSAFAKLTEHMDYVERARPLLHVGRGLVVAGATLGALAVAAGGLPLVWHALREAARRRDRRLAVLLATPAIAGGMLLASSGLLVGIAPSRHNGFGAGFVLALPLPLTLGVLACALTGALAPKAVMRRSRPPASLLRVASWAGQVLALAIGLVAAGLALYVAKMWSADAGMGASGPLGLSTRLTLVPALAGALICLGPAAVAARRARTAALARS